MSIADKLAYLAGTKAAIRQAIEAQGVAVGDELPFRQYAGKIGDIEGGGSPSDGDPHWESVAALLHFDGSFDNERPASVNSHSAQLYNGWLLGGKLANRGVSVDIGLLGKDDFCIEFTLCRDFPANQNATILDTRAATGTYDGVLITFPGADTSLVAAYAGLGGSAWSATAESIDVVPAYEFAHIAITRSGDTFRLFLNGKLQGAEALPTGADIGGSSWLFLGQNLNGTASTGVEGAMRELRVTRGVARYTEDFDPPTEPFPNYGVTP